MTSRTQTLIREADGGVVRRTVLPGGLRVVTEQVPGVRSVTFGIWVGVGSRDETASHTGSAHYLEHLLFKGTTKRSALEISSLIEAVGGDLNAYTTKEYTCYYARVLDVDLPLAIDVVSDVVTDALIREDDVEAERGVILEEIAMHDDDPGDVIHDAFSEALFGQTPLGRPILGTTETILNLRRSSINTFYRKSYKAGSMVVAAAGNLDHATVVRLVRKAFKDHLDDATTPTRRGHGMKARSKGLQSHVVSRPTEQAHVMLGGSGFARYDDRRYATAVLSTALGGGMSSRLFQEVREKRGLAYSVYSFHQGFMDTGMFGIYAGCLPSKADTVLDVCLSQIEDVVRNGLSAEEIARAKGQVKGSAVLGQEDTGARMTRLGKSELHGEPLISLGESLARVDAVTPADLEEVARRLLDQPLTLAVIGPFDPTHTFNAVA